MVSKDSVQYDKNGEKGGLGQTGGYHNTLNINNPGTPLQLGKTIKTLATSASNSF